MKLRFFILLAIISIFGTFSTATAQVDSVLGQFTNSNAESFAGGISGNGRFVVFESRANLATENPRNADNNREIFLFDYAQRRIFQLTDTKPLLIDSTKAFTFDNIKVEIANIRPVISNDGRWIAFGSNATIAFPGTSTSPPIISETNPGSFDANSFTVRTTNPTAETNSLTADGNLEMWLYQIPAVAPANLTSGEEIPVTNLSAGTFTRVTNTPPSRLPVPATVFAGAFVADDNHDASISNDGNIIAFVSTRDLVTGGNASPQVNDEIFTYLRSSNQFSQVTNTPRGTAANPIYNVSPSLSGSGTRVAFASNASVPITGMTATNTDNNEEIFYTDLTVVGAPSVGTARQITVTSQAVPGDIVNVWNFGRRMSLDGRYIAFDSYAALSNIGSGGTNTASFALYLYDTNPGSTGFTQIGPRSDADSGASGGDVAHYPGFTDYSISGTPATLVFSTRLNIKADGTIPATAADGLNPNAARPVQIYSYPLSPVTAPAATFTRLTNFPTPNSFLASTQAIPSDSVKRITFNLGLTEPGTGNFDLLIEIFYLLLPEVSGSSTAAISFETGASRLTVSPSPVPTPTPGATPTPSPTPTPQTPSAVQGVSPGMLAVVNFDPRTAAVATRAAVGSLARSFTLPIQLSGVTLTVNGAAAGLKSVSSGEIEFVVPPGLTGTAAGTEYQVVINLNGTVIKGKIVVVPARPDVFTNLTIPGPGGRARVFNATNTVLTTEPFTVTTIRRRGERRVPTVLRLYLTGVQNLPATAFTIRIGSTTISGAQITSNAILVEPGVYSVDFTLPPELNRAGDQPIIVSVLVGGVTYFARLDDTAPRLFIL